MLTSDEVSYYNFSDCWAEMPLNKNSASDAGAQLVSSLMVRLGYLFESGYKPDGTSTYNANIKPVLSSAFNISSTYVAYDEDILIQQINSLNNPVVLMMYGYDSSIQANVGHHFLADGYRKLTENYTYVYKTMDETSTTYKYIQNAETYVNEYVSLNWGYDGSGDINNQGGVIWYNLDSSFSYQYNSGTVVYNMPNSI
ncbi:MAG: C10 family peptidase [Candidatus Cryptobacteroides sp.]